MKITEDTVPRYGTAKKNISEQEAIQHGREENSKAFVKADTDVYEKLDSTSLHSLSV